MIKKKNIFLIFLFFIFLVFFLFNNIFLDTGYKFAFDYIKNKVNNNFRENQKNIGKIKYLNKDNQIFENKKDIIGWSNNFYTDDEFNNKLYSKNEIQETEHWIRSNGGNYSNKYSSLDQININNINNLDLLWQYDSSQNFLWKKKWQNNTETNPIFYDGVIYLTTSYSEVVAINALSGKLLWKFKSLKKIDSRGIVLWLNKNNLKNSCIFVPIRNSVFCINYKSGKRMRSFGIDGYIKTSIVRSAPVIWQNNLIVATLNPPKIKMYSLPLGKLIWELPLHPDKVNFEGGTPWGGISLDEERNLLFVTTGNPRPALYGADRPGDNENSNSIIAIDLKNRNIKWSFQEVSHDLWDYDIASPPILTSIRNTNKIIDVVVVITKIGNTFIFNRENGKPFFDIKYREAPISKVIGENTSPFQIFKKLPEPTINFQFNVKDLDNRSREDLKKIKSNIDDYKYGWFEPPSLKKTLILYGLHGGAQWPGGVVDPLNQNLYLPVNQIPWKIKLYLTSNEDFPEKYKLNYELYKSQCSSCHGLKRNGIYKTEKEKEIEYFPSLINLYNDDNLNFKDFFDLIKKKHNNKFNKQEINKIYDLFKVWDKKIYENNTSEINFQWSQFLYKDDMPATKPPWGKIVSLNLLNGKINWEVPNGYIGNKKIGTSNFGGIVATKGDIIFATGTDDNKIIALNVKNGNELWSYTMEAAGSAPPSTFMYKNKQILIVVSSGGRYHNYKHKSGLIYAFALK